MISSVEPYRKSAVDGMEMFLRNFSKVPDDRLSWTPTPTAKSALRIAAHTALYAGRFAKMIRDRKLPIVDNLEAWEASLAAEEGAVGTRSDVERIFREGTDQVLAAFDSITEEELLLDLDSGQGWTMSMSFLLTLPGWHAVLHTGQIDFLQTCWGDHEIYV